MLAPAAVGAALARCPVGWLAPLAPEALALSGLGLHTLADVAALPAAAVSGRFGPAALAAWRALHGDEAPLLPTPAPPRLRARRAFAGPLLDRAALELAIGRLAARLATGLQRRGLAARGLALHLHPDQGHPHVAGRTLERPAATAAALGPIAIALMAAALPDKALERAPEICAVELMAGELLALRGEQLTLFGPAPGLRAEAMAAFDDLAARMGPGGLLRPGAAGLAPWGAP